MRKTSCALSDPVLLCTGLARPAVSCTCASPQLALAATLNLITSNTLSGMQKRSTLAERLTIVIERKI